MNNNQSWRGRPGDPGQEGEPGIAGGGKGGAGGSGGAGGDSPRDIVERIAVLETKLAAHEQNCSASRNMLYGISGTFVVALLAMLWHLMTISNEQTGVMARLDEHTTRMNAITQAAATRDEGIRNDFKELQREIQQHIQMEWPRDRQQWK